MIEPLLAKAGVEPKGRVCIGTVKGDLHDIGKNLVAMMLKGAGYEVDDLGVDCPKETYVSAIDRGAQVVCLSALLTTMMSAMQEVVSHLREAGFDVPVVVGGAPISQQFAEKLALATTPRRLTAPWQPSTAVWSSSYGNAVGSARPLAICRRLDRSRGQSPSHGARPLV